MTTTAIAGGSNAPLKKTLIIRTIDNDGTLVIDVLQDGYNIIEQTVYGATDLAQALLDYIEEN